MLRTYWPAIVIMLIALIISTRFVAPAPPKEIHFATGAEMGAYALTAEAYKRVFDDKDVGLEILTTNGSGENLALLRNGEADAAIVQGGLATPEDADLMMSLGAIFFEPLWVFYRQGLLVDGEAPDELRDMNGLRIAAGSANSGTRGLVSDLLAHNAVDAELFTMSSAEGAEALRNSDVDVLMAVSGPDAPFVLELLSDPNIAVMSFKRALAYERRFPYLKRVIFPEGGLDLHDNLPGAPIELISPAAEIVVSKKLHPAIQALLIEAMVDTHRRGTLLAEPGTFPNPDRIDLALADEAERFYSRGPSFLRRYFPFAVANFLERAWVLMIPLVTLAIPLARAAPPIYRWRTRRKIYIWYKDLRELERRGRAATTDEELTEVRLELAHLQAEVGRVEVPEAYTDELYRLRSHILFVNELVGRMDLRDGDAQMPSTDTASH